MRRQPKQTAFFGLRRGCDRPRVRISEPLTCQPHRKAHMSRLCAVHALKPLALRVPSACARQSLLSRVDRTAHVRPALPPLPDVSGFPRRPL
jgi:hypothetical protein